MGILDFLFGGNNGSGKKEEVDEILAMTFDDPDFDELAEIGLIPGSNPGQDDEFDDDDNNSPTTEPLRDRQGPFK